MSPLGRSGSEDMLPVVDAKFKRSRKQKMNGQLSSFMHPLSTSNSHKKLPASSSQLESFLSLQIQKIQASNLQSKNLCITV